MLKILHALKCVVFKNLDIINTIIIALSFIAVYSINKTRSGAAVAIKEILKSISSRDLTWIIFVIIASGILSFILGIKIAKIVAVSMNKINHKTLTIITLLILFIINLVFTNLIGVLVLLIATSLSIFTILSNSRRINLMATLLIPTIVFYLTI